MNYDNVETIRLVEHHLTVINYTLNGKYHRTDGPAIIWYCPDDTVNLEMYYLHGKLHREDGPASIWYHSDGTIDTAVYYLHDILMKDF